MTTARRVITVLAIAAAVLFVFTGCYWDWTVVVDPPESDPLYSFSLEWRDNSTDDPHLYITYPAPVSGDTTEQGTPVFTEPYTLPDPLVGDLGFYPVDVGDGVPLESETVRGTVYYGNRTSEFTRNGRPALEMVEQDSSSELVYLRGFPFASSSTATSTTGGGLTGLDPGTYTWVGIMKVYAYATAGSIARSGENDVDAVLHVYRYGEPFVSYELPDVDLKGMSLFQINCFYEGDTEVYQFVPDGRLIQSSSQIRSLSDGVQFSDNGVFTVYGNEGAR